MNKCLEFFLNNHLYWCYFLIALIMLLESTVMIGLFFPSTLLMFMIGFMLGKKKLNIYYTLCVSILGALLGDIFSYYLGTISNKDAFLKKYIVDKYSYFINKILFFLNKYSFLTIPISKLFSPLRSFLMFVLGMLSYSVEKIFIPDLLGIIIWIIVYFMPGILTGVAVSIPNSTFFSIQFILILLLFSMILYIGQYIYFFSIRTVQHINQYYKLINLIILMIFILIYFIKILINDPLLIIFSKLLYYLFT